MQFHLKESNYLNKTIIRDSSYKYTITSTCASKVMHKALTFIPDLIGEGCLDKISASSSVY
jgi:hypothetical protein